MSNQQSERRALVLSALNSFLSGAVLSQADHQAQQKLITLSHKSKLLPQLLSLIKQTLCSCEEVVIRLKLLCLLQQLISHHSSPRITEKVSSIISTYETLLKKRRPGVSEESDTGSCLQANVELPYLFFLRKMLSWQGWEIQGEGSHQIDLAFSLINKMKDTLQLKRIFHNFGCYYPSHLYAVSLFRSTLATLRQLWGQVCSIVREVTEEALQTSTILAEEYLLICAAEEMQDRLMEFVYGGYFSKRIGKEERIKYVSLLRPEIKALQDERRRRSSSERAMKELLSKRESRRELQEKGEGVTGESENMEKMNTELQLQILDSMLRLQSLLCQ